MKSKCWPLANPYIQQPKVFGYLKLMSKTLNLLETINYVFTLLILKFGICGLFPVTCCTFDMTIPAHESLCLELCLYDKVPRNCLED